MTSSLDQLRIVLIGKTGNGKSSTGNSILHSRTAFHSTQSAQSITRDCELKTGQCKDGYGKEKPVLVVDTPGFFDTDENIDNKMVEKKIASQIFQMTSPGVHAFLIVLRVDRFTPEEKHTVDFIKTIFGTNAAKYCIVIFTREDQLDEGQTLDAYISSSAALRELIAICGNRKLAINNKLGGQALEKKTQELLQMIQVMINNNNGTYYTNAEYQRIEQQRREEQRKREEAELARKKAYEESLVAATREKERRRGEQLAQQAREEEQRKAAKRIKEAEEEAERQKEQLKREKRAREDAEEARRRTEERARRDAEMARMESARIELRSGCYSQPLVHHGGDDDSNGLSSLLSQMMLGGGMGSGNPISSMNTSMGMPSFSARSSSGAMGGGHGGRFTGDYMATRGAANGRPIYEGARGGMYHMTANGNRSYLPK